MAQLEAVMQHDPDSTPAKPRAPHATADDMDEPVGRDEDTKQRELDERDKGTHEASENELPSTQDKNPVPPASTRR
jgi:hypothetical protein